MQKAIEAISREELADRWLDWVVVLRLFAAGRPESRQIDAACYEVLQHRILSMLRGGGVPGVAPALLCEMEELITPWLSTETLHWAEPEILVKLLAQAERLQRRLGGRFTRGLPAWWWWTLGAAATLIVAILLHPAAQAHRGLWLATRRWGAGTWERVVQWSGGHPIMVAGALITLALVFVLWRFQNTT